jgi:hypothetical protein
VACELPARHERPLGRFSRTELHRLVIEEGVCDASATTIWRWLHDRSLKPGLSDEVCVVVVTDSALVAGKDTDDHQDHL